MQKHQAHRVKTGANHLDADAIQTAGPRTAHPEDDGPQLSE